MSKGKVYYRLNGSVFLVIKGESSVFWEEVIKIWEIGKRKICKIKYFAMMGKFWIFINSYILLLEIIWQSMNVNQKFRRRKPNICKLEYLLNR